MPEQVVTELVIDARTAEIGSAQYVRAMQAAQASVDRMIQRENDYATAQEKQVAMMTRSSGSIGTTAKAWDRLKASVDPAFRSLQQMQKDLLTADAAIIKLGADETEVARVLDMARLKHDAVAAAAQRQAEEYRKLAAAGREAYAADQAQTSINHVLGITPAIGGSAQASASAFEAELSRLDEIARLKGQQAGTQFGQAFNQSLSANLSGKSAQASASIFEAEARAVAMLRAELNPTAAAQDRLNAELAEYAALAERGAISAKELAQAQAMARSRGTAGGSGRFAGMNATSQFQDIAITSAMGQSIPTIALQQGTQLGMALQMSLGEQGAAGGAKALLAGITGLFNPINLLAIGITGVAAATIQWFTSTTESAGQAKAKLDDYLKSIDAIRDSYGDASNAAADFAKKTVTELEAAERRARALLEISAQAQNKDLLGQLSPLNTGSFFGSFQSSDVKSVFAPFQYAIDDLRAGIQAGNPDFDAFEKHIQTIAATDPSFTKWGDELVRTAEEAATTNRVLDGTRDALNGISQSQMDTSRIVSQLNNIEDAAKTANAEAGALLRMLNGIGSGLDGRADAKGDAISGKGALDRAQASFDEQFDLWRRFGNDNDSRLDPNTPIKTKVDHTAERNANAYRDLIKSADDRLAQMRLEAETSGMVGIAADALRFKLDLLQKGEEKGRSLSPDQRAEIEQKAKAYELLATAAATADVQQKLLSDRAQLFRNPIDQQIASMQQSAGLPIDLNSAEAGMLRLNTQIGMTQDAWRSFGNSAEDALTRLVDGTGNWRDVLVSMIPVAKDLIVQLLSAQSVGSGGSGDFSIGGLLAKAAGSLFGAGLGGGSAMDPFQDVFASARGNVAAGPGISAYSNTIVSQPTFFPFAKGIGLMGEAGDEAIMPLRRGPDGRLGVAAANQNGVTFQIIDQRTNAPAIEQESATGPNGEQITRFIVRDEIKRSGVGSVAQHARNHQEAKKRSMIK